RSPPVIVKGGPSRVGTRGTEVAGGVGPRTAFRKWTRRTVCRSSTISTKSMPLTDVDLTTLVRRFFGSISAHLDHRDLSRLRLVQHVFALHDDLRIVSALAGGALDLPALDLPGEPLVQGALDDQPGGCLEGVGVGVEEQLTQPAAE